MMKKYCKNCSRLLPPGKTKYCVGARHDCDCNDTVNKWRESLPKQFKISFPKNGIILIDKHRFLHGQGCWWENGKFIHKYYFIKRYESCYHEDCKMRATFWGYEVDKLNRVYSIHKCIMGHENSSQLVEEDGPELTKYLSHVKNK